MFAAYDKIFTRKEGEKMIYKRADFMDVLYKVSKKDPDKHNPLEQFAKAFRDGNVDLSLKLYKENNLDSAYLSFGDRGASSVLYDCIQECNNESQLKIIEGIVLDQKSDRINDFYRGDEMGAYRNNYSPLCLACKLNKYSVVEILLQRDDINLEHEVYVSYGGIPYKKAFDFALDNALNGQFESLALILKSGKLDLSNTSTNEPTYAVSLGYRRFELQKAFEQRLNKIKPPEFEEFAKEQGIKDFDKLKETAEKFPTLGSIAMPKKPRFLFGKRKKEYLAAVDEFNVKQDEYEYAEHCNNQYKKLQEQYEKKVDAYNAEFKHLSKQFKVVKDTIKKVMEAADKKATPTK